MASAKPKTRSRKTATAKPRKTSTKRHSTKKKKTARRSTADVRSQVHKLTLKALRDGNMKLSDIPKLAQQFIEGAAAGLNNAVPQSGRNVLRQVVDGLTDAAEATVHSTRTAVKSMATRGASFVKNDATRTMKDLGNLESDFVAALERAGKSLKGAAKDELDSIVRNARQAGTRIKPAARSAMKAADGHLMELGKEAAGATARAAKSAASTVIHGASGLLQGLGDAMDKKRSSAGKSKRS
jgi:hypothetical protein